MKLIEQLEKYQPVNEQEEKDKSFIISCLKQFDNIFSRENNLAHMTASAWVVNKTHDKVLMAYHNIYDSWSWLGGHADGETDLLSSAMREVEEESGIHNINPVSEDIYSLEVLTVDGHIKRGKYVSSHLHLNVTYLLEADEDEALSIKPNENSGVKWIKIDELEKYSNEPYLIGVYRKIHKKVISKANK